jgi:hypothetical protein
MGGGGGLFEIKSWQCNHYTWMWSFNFPTPTVVQECYKSGLPNLSHAWPKRHAERFPWHAAFADLPICYFFYPIVCVCVCVYIHVYDSVRMAYELAFLPNYNTNETFVHKSGTLRSVVLIFIIGLPAWR